MVYIGATDVIDDQWSIERTLNTDDRALERSVCVKCLQEELMGLYDVLD